MITHPVGRLLPTFQETLLEFRPGTREEGFYQAPSPFQVIRRDDFDLRQVFLQGRLEVRNRKTR